MGVTIDGITIAGIGAGGGANQITAVTQFTPDLTVVDNQRLSNKFIKSDRSLTATTTDTLAASNDVAGLMRFSRVGGTGNNPSQVCIYPIPLLNTRVEGKAQFAEGRIISKLNGSSSVGPCAMTYGAATALFHGYSMLTATGNNTTFIVTREKQNNLNVTVNTTVGWALNDMARLEVRPLGGQSFDIRVLRNGANVATFVDTHVDAPEDGFGYPGFMINAIFIPTNSNSIWSDISFGIL